MLIVGLRRSCFSCFCSKFKKWCHGDRSHASLVLVACRRPVVVSVVLIGFSQLFILAHQLEAGGG
jgi:hypothetical protein